MTALSPSVATAEVGQGFITIAPQIARSTLGLEEVELDTIDTNVGSAGSTSASRQTWMSGGAVEAACLRVRELVYQHVATAEGTDPLVYHRRNRTSKYEHWGPTPNG